MSPAKADEPIEMRFGLWTRMDRRNHVLGHGPDPPGNLCTRRCALLSNYFDLLLFFLNVSYMYAAAGNEEEDRGGRHDELAVVGSSTSVRPASAAAAMQAIQSTNRDELTSLTTAAADVTHINIDDDDDDRAMVSAQASFTGPDTQSAEKNHAPNDR